MTYKKYIKRGGKTFGPYAYHSKKINGKVISEYQGKYEKKTNKNIWIFISISLILLSSLFFVVKYASDEINFQSFDSIKESFSKSFNSLTGFDVLDSNNSEQTPEADSEPEQPVENISETPLTEQNNSNEEIIPVINDTIIANESSVINETSPENITINENDSITSENQTNLTEINITETINESLENFSINETDINDVNITENITEINITELNITNETLTNITEINITQQNITGINATISTIQYQAVLGQPVKWKKEITPENIGNITVNIPGQAENISVTKISNDVKENITSQISLTGAVIGSQKSFLSGFFEKIWGAITGKAIDDSSSVSEKEIEIQIDEPSASYEVEYETPAPYAIEEEKTNGKRVTIVGPENLHYENVLSFTNLNENLGITNPSSIKIYWIENSTYFSPSSIQDLDNNGVYDYVEWNVPHLSNQTFEIIVITKAEHLDSNRGFISDIYEQVKSLDDVWSGTINENEYVRVTFEMPLDNTRDITIYPRIISGSPTIEVYEKDGNESIAAFSPINSSEYNKVFLTNLIGQQDTFDLKVIGGSVEFDYIVDPQIPQYTGGLLVYADTVDVGMPKYKTFNGTFGIEQNATSVGASAIEWIRVSANPTNNEWIIATRDAGDAIKAQVCTGTDTGISCGAVTTIAGAAGAHGFRNYDIAYEKLSGNALLVYGNNTADALNSIEWTGSWTNNVSITTTRTSGTVEWVELTARNNSNQIGIAYSDTNDDVSAYRWNGTAAIDEANMAINTAAPAGDVRKFDISFEGTSGDMLVASPNTTAGTTATGALSGTTWTRVNQTGPDVLTAYIDLQEPGPDNDIAMTGHGTAATTLSEGYEWDGGAIVDSTNGDDNVAAWAANQMRNSVAFLNNTYYAVAAFANSTGTDDIDWWTMNSAGTITDRAANARARGATRFNDLFDYPTQHKVLLITSDANSDLWADTWDGATLTLTSWTDLTSGGALETSLSSATLRPWDFAFRLSEVTASDITPPTWNLNSSNSTVAGQAVLHSVKWTDETALSGYIFSFDNGTGAFVNDSFASFTGTEDWSNVTKGINSTVGSTIRWIQYANDSSNNWNGTDIFQYTTTSAPDITPPEITINFPQNATYSAVLDLPFNFSISLNEEGSAIYSIDDENGNVIVNTTMYNSTGGILGTEFNSTLDALPLGDYTFNVYANDTLGNNNRTNINFTLIQEYFLINGSVVDSSGNSINTTLTIINETNQEVFYNETNDSHEDILVNLDSTYTLQVEPHDIQSVDTVSFNNMNFSEANSTSTDLLKIDEVNNTESFDTVFAIQPLMNNFATASVSFTAKANSLYKCDLWNFTNQACDGTWMVYMKNLKIGDKYSFYLKNESRGFGIINISKAEHLDSSRALISDITEQVETRDDTWSETIPSGDYVRVTFEVPLDNTKDITIYPRVVSGSPYIEVYEVNQSTALANFSPITSNQYNKILLTNLAGEQDTFDLHVLGGSVEFDHIVDPISSAFVDGVDVVLSATAQTNIASLTTTLPAGTNIVIASVQLNSTDTGVESMAAGNLRLNKQGGATLSSNDYAIPVYTTGTHNSYVLIAVDTSAGSNQAYNVTGQSSATAVDAEAKIVVMSAMPYYDFNDSASTAISTTGVEIAGLQTDFPAGDNIILAAIEIDSGATAQKIIAGGIRIGKSGTILASNQFHLNFGPSAPDDIQTIFLIAKDTGAAANTRYNVTILGPQAAVAAVKAIAFQVPGSAYVDGASIAVPGTATVFANLTTAFAAGQQLVVIGTAQFNDTDTSIEIINASNFQLREDGTAKSTNQHAMQAFNASGSTADGFGHTLIWRNASSGANVVYSLSAVARATGLNVEGKIVALDLTDTDAPTWSLNTSNGTAAGTIVLHSVRWDDFSLSGYVFSFDNGTGTFVNDSFVEFSRRTNWSNVSKGINATGGSVIRWRVYSNDSSNNLNVTDTFQYTALGDNPPQWFTPSTNDSTPDPGQLISHIVNWTDDNGLRYAILEVNGTGANCNTLSNVTTNSSLSGTATWVNLSWTIPSACEGKAIGWKQYANDSSNNWNVTDQQNYTVNNINPIASFGTNPVNAYNSSSSSITFDLKVSDNSAVNGLRLYGNWSGAWAANQTNSSPVNDTFWNVTVTGIPEGRFAWAAWGNDTRGNFDFTDTNRTITVDLTNPASVINAPANDTWTNDSTPSINITLTDNFDSSIIYNIYVNDSINKTGSVSNNTPTNITLDGQPQGLRVIIAEAVDDFGRKANSSAVYLKIDTAIPQIQFVSPTENNATSKTQNYIFANVSVTEANFKNITYTLQNSTGIVNQTTYTGLVTQINWTGLSSTNVQYQYNVSIYDLADNLNRTETRYLTLIPNQAPNVAVLYPANITYNSNVSQLNYSATDDSAVSFCWYSLNGGANSTPSAACSNFTGLTSNEGRNTWTVYANDSAGLENFSSISFTKDTVPPSLIINSPLNQSYNSNSIVFNATSTDVTLSVGACWYSLNGGATNVTLPKFGSSDFYNRTNSSMIQGSQTARFYCNDTAGNLNGTQNVTFFIDSINPLVNYTTGTPANNSNLSRNYIFVNVSVTETNFANITFRLFNSTGQVNVTAYTSPIFSINFTNLPNAVYTFNVTISDTLSNQNSTGTMAARLDTIKPDVQFVSRTTSAGNFSQNYIEANASASDSGAGLSTITIFLYNSTGVVATSISTTSYNFTNFTNLADGTYSLNATANDSAGNINQTETRIVLLDTGAPQISIVYPQNITYGLNVNQLNYSVSDTTLAFCWYSLNGGVNTTITCGQNISGLTSSEGSNTWTVYANDTSGNTNSSSVTFFKDTIFPQFSNYLRNPSAPNEDQAVQVNITVTEANKRAVILEFNNGTAVNRTVATNNGDEYFFTINTGNYTAHDLITYYWYANDTAGNTNKSSQQSFTVANQIPSVSAPAINDTTPGTDEMISCNGGLFFDNDAEDNTEQMRYFRWFENDIEISGQVSQTLNLSVSGLNRGDVIKCSARVYDGFDNSTFVNSSNTATIQNSAPAITNTLTSVSWNANGSAFTYDYDATDADSDSIIWYDNTTLFDINQTGYISDTPTESEAGVYAIRINASDGVANATDDFTYTINDVTPPNVQFVAFTEANNSQLTRNYIQANVTASDVKGIGTITLRLYNSTSIVQTNTSSSGSLFVNFTSLPDAFYYLNATANDSSGNSNRTETLTVSTDTGAPAINYVSPTENSGVIRGRNYIQVNVTASDPNLDKITIRLYNSLNSQINSSVSGTSPNFINFTNLADGLYFYNATANDTFGNSNPLITRNITLDATDPSITSLTEYPSDPAQYSPANIYVFNATITDANLHIVLIEFDGVNHTPSQSGNAFNYTTSNLSGGIHSYYWYANDTAGRASQTAAQNYTVNKNAEACNVLFNETSPINYPNAFLVWSDCSSAFALSRNGTAISNNSVQSISAGTYNFTVIRTDQQNYSNVYDEKTFAINNAAGGIVLLINGSAQNQTGNYGIQTNASASTLYGTATLYRNGTNVTSQNNIYVTLAAGYYNYTAVSSGDQNHSSASASLFVTISKSQSEINLTLNGTRGNINIVQDSVIPLNLSTIVGDSGATLSLYKNGTLINQGSSPLGNQTAFNQIGLFNITGIYSDSENYTADSETWWVNVTQTPDIANPAVASLTESPADPATYSINGFYQFNATITDNRQLHTVLINFNGTNFTPENLAGNIYNFNRTSLQVGNYSYRWFANDTSGNANNTQNGTYTINKATPSLSITVLPSISVTYPTETNTTGIGCSQVTCTLYRNQTAVNNSDIATLAAGVYNYTYNTTGNANNTGASSSQNLTINKSPSACNVSLSQTSPVGYGTSFNVWANCDTSFLLYRNGTSISNNSQQNLSVGTYNFTVIRTDQQNYSNVYDEKTFSVDRAAGAVFTYLDNSRANKTIEQFTAIYLNGTLENGTGTIRLYNNGTLINQGSSPLSNLTNFTVIGLYNITAVYDGNENYTDDSETWWLTATEVDTTSPQINATYPLNKTYNAVQTQLNYTASDNIGLTSCWYSLDNGATNTTITCGQNISGLTSSEGSNTWTVYANDARGNENNSEVTFFVDSIKPGISFTFPTPENATAQTTNSVYVNVSTSDSNEHSAFIDFNRSLMGWWNFESVLSNGTVYDGSPYKNDGLMLNFTSNSTVPGKRGQAIELNGGNATVNYIETSDIELPQEFTISAWFKIKENRTAGSDQHIIISKWQDSSGQRVSYHLGIRSGKLAAVVSNYSGTQSAVQVLGTTTIGLNQWYYGVATFKNGNLTVYLNGIRENQINTSFTSLYNPSVKARIGAFSFSWTAYKHGFNGTLDEVMLFNRSLTTKEINASYNAGLYKLSNNFTGLSAGTYEYKAYATDIAGNINSTETRTVSLIKPSLTIFLPENKTYLNNQNLKLNFTVLNADYIWYSIDLGSNTTILGNTTFNTSDGQHVLYLWANNSNGNSPANATFTANVTKFIIRYSSFRDNGSSTDFNSSNYEDVQNLSDVVLEKTGMGKVSFNQAINLTDDENPADDELDLDSNINISNNFIQINSTALPNFNKSATLYLYNLAFSSPRILRNGDVCPAEICTQQSYSGGTLAFTVTQFSNYSAEESPVSITPAGGGDGGQKGGSAAAYECTQDSQCTDGKVCWEGTCVKLFDVKITDFKSPVKLGDFFEFTYFLKGQADINSDVIVNFWIENKSERVTSGSDTIYMGSFEEKTETAKIFLPTTLKSGVYEFFVEVYHERYQARSHRTIQIEVKDGIATITSPAETDIKVYIIFGLIILVLVLFFIIHLRRDARKSGRALEKKPARIREKLIEEKPQIAEEEFHERRHLLHDLLVKIRTALSKRREPAPARRIHEKKAYNKEIGAVEEEVSVLRRIWEKIHVAFLRIKYGITSIKPKYEAGIYKKEISAIEHLPGKIFKSIKPEIPIAKKTGKISKEKQELKLTKPIKPKKGPKTVQEIIEEIRKESEKEE